MFNFGKKFQPKTKNKIGLDLGSSTIKMLEIENAGDKAALLSIGMKKIADPSRQTLIESIKSLAEELKLSTKEVNISVSGPSAIVRFISLPKMREDELKGAIKFEAEKHIPFAIDDCIIDYQILKKNEKENKFDILLVAAKKEFILDKIAVLEDCALSIGVVDVDSFAVTNAYLKNFACPAADKTAALLNIGAKFTNVSIVQGDILCFSRDVAIGGADFAAAISKNMINNLVDEMRLSFSYYENQSGRGVDEIYICGGASGLVGMEAAFLESFESKPALWDPLKFLDTSKVSQNQDLVKKMNGSFAVAAGLAIR